MNLLVLVMLAQLDQHQLDAARGWTLSIETDPVFWVGTLPNGAGVDANLDVTVAAVPGLRIGLLGYSGAWRGAFGRAVILPPAFSEPDWGTRWSGAGLEAQYQLHFGLGRGGLGFGLRLQWNHFDFDRGRGIEAIANHLVVTPQVGFQWYPFHALGLYVLPWAGVQVPVAGTSVVQTTEGPRETRRVLPVFTAHLGWAF